MALTLLTACAFAQETPTEREAARVVLQKMDALETSLDVPGWVAKLSAPDAARDAVTVRAKQLMDTEFLTMGDDITRHPEIGFQETRSVGILVDYLKAHKFDVTVGVAKLSTAFVARYQGNRGAPSLGRCKDVGDELKAFLAEECGVPGDDVEANVLIVYSGAPDLLKLASVDAPGSKVEWIISVSMLNEGWDVKRVFQIVPHEERAFNSKLLIAQVLGRGLRIPNGWNEQPTVTVFNHDGWAARIRHLVNEVLELDKRLSSDVVVDSANNFDLDNIDYTLTPASVKKPMTGEYTLFAKGYVDLATDSPEEDVVIKFERARTGET